MPHPVPAIKVGDTVAHFRTNRQGVAIWVSVSTEIRERFKNKMVVMFPDRNEEELRWTNAFVLVGGDAGDDDDGQQATCEEEMSDLISSVLMATHPACSRGNRILKRKNETNQREVEDVQDAD